MDEGGRENREGKEKEERTKGKEKKTGVIERRRERVTETKKREKGN